MPSFPVAAARLSVDHAARSAGALTFAFSEVVGRSYGGGMLELQPREAEALPFPHPHGLTVEDVAAVDAILRRGELLAALDYVDRRLLVDGAGMDQALVDRLRGAWMRLRDRRLARGRKSTA
jgi:adenine-specific DNA methylase